MKKVSLSRLNGIASRGRGNAPRLAALAAVLVAAACTTTTTTTPNGGSSGNGSSGGDTSSADGGGGSNPGGETLVRSGTISLSQSVMNIAGTDYSSYTAIATFIETTSAGTGSTGSSSCTQSTDGDCSIVACDTTGAVASDGGVVSDAGAPKKSPTAGEITVKGLKEITLTPDDKGSYTAKFEQVALWKAGEDVSVKAAGAEVPAFEKTLKSPSTVIVSEPTWPAVGQAIDVDRANDLDFTWADGGPGTVQAAITSAAGGKTTLITCKFKADAGTGKISKAALSKLVATDTGTLSLTAMSSEVVDASGWKINVLALTSATTSGGGAASGMAKIK
jgi:hypothetical protein